MTLILETPTKEHSVRFTDQNVVLMAGPCAVESYDQTRRCALAVSQVGGHVLRGGAFKPRTSPHSFQGLGIEGLKILRAVADEFDLLVVTEALGVEHVPVVADYADIIQIGSRNMQHYPLLWAVGEAGKPVLLKRGFMATVREWLLAAEHISSRGNDRLILCERGVRSFSTTTGNILDVNAITFVRQTTDFPVIADPSHATGQSNLVLPAALASIAAGAHGLLVEIHPDPRSALSDGEQAVPLSSLPHFALRVAEVALALGRTLE